MIYNKFEDSSVQIKSINLIHTALSQTKCPKIIDNPLALKFEQLGGTTAIEEISSKNECLINAWNALVGEFYNRNDDDTFVDSCNQFEQYQNRNSDRMEF